MNPITNNSHTSNNDCNPEENNDCNPEERCYMATENNPETLCCAPSETCCAPSETEETKLEWMERYHDQWMERFHPLHWMERYHGWMERYHGWMEWYHRVTPNGRIDRQIEEPPSLYYVPEEETELYVPEEETELRNMQQDNNLLLSSNTAPSQSNSILEGGQTSFPSPRSE